MKAVVQDVYGTSEVLRVEEVPTPTPGPDQVLVRVKAVGVDAGVWHLMTGLPLIARVALGPRRPKTGTLGMELSGVVDAVGANVTELRVGDEVFGGGSQALAEYALAKPALLALKPAGVSFEQAAAVPVSGTTALQALKDRVTPGTRVLVVGAGGGVGSYAVQIAKARGAYVTGVGSASKQEFIRSLGADAVIDYAVADLGTERHDLIVDTAGNRSLRTLRRSLVKGGRLVIVGGENGSRFGGGLWRNLTSPLVGRFTGHPSVGLIALQTREDIQALRELLESGAVVPPVDTVYPLARAAEAIDHFAEGRVKGKVVVAVG